MVKIYYDDDADLGILKDRKIAIVGYGSQGHAQAQNLKDSGCDVIVAEKEGGPIWDIAEKDGFDVMNASDASKEAGYIQILLPDELHPIIYKNDILSNLEKGDVLAFSHGFNIHYGQIVPPDFVDVVMIAPKSPGHLVRRMYQEGGGVPGLLAVHQDASGNAASLAKAYAKGIGCTRAGLIETSFKEETETDLFGEQVDLCGGVTAMIKMAFEVLVEAGYNPEMAYFETLHELKLIVDLIYEGGLRKMWNSVSNTAEYGGLTKGPVVINEASRDAMYDLLSDIQDGTFAKEWVLENQANMPTFHRLQDMDINHPIEIVGRKLRAMMPWLEEE